MEKASLDQDQAVEPPDQVIRCTRALNRAAARVADVIPAIRQLQAAGKLCTHHRRRIERSRHPNRPRPRVLVSGKGQALAQANRGLIAVRLPMPGRAA